MISRILIVILLLFTIIFIVYIMNKKDSIKDSIKSLEFTQKDIINKFNSSGLLITLNTTDLYCSEYIENLKICDNDNDNCKSNCPLGQSDLNCECINISQCTIKDVSDIANILNINKKVAQTTCFAVDTTYLHKSIPPILFGPYIGVSSFPIGIILDYDIIKQYIGCAYSFDAGTIARNPDKSIADSCLQSALNITDEKILNGELHKGTIDKITNDNCPPTSMIGCLNSDGNYKPQLTEFDITKSPNVQKCDDIETEYCLSQNAFWDPNSNPFYEGNESGMNLFKKDVIKTQDILGKQIRNTFDYNNINSYSGKDYAPDYWGYTKNRYRENEVDLFIPQKNGTDINKVCNPTDKFKEIWKEAIIGIFTNNICNINTRYNNKIKSGYNCCLSSFNEDLVKKLVETFNQNSNKKINGYVINTIPQDRRVESTTGIYNLDIRQIT